MKKSVRIGALVTTAVLAASAPGIMNTANAAPVTMSRGITVPVRVRATVDHLACDNTGSTIELNGSLEYGGLGVRMRFSNNMKGTRQVTAPDQELNIEVTPTGGSVSVPKQPSRGGVGGNPWISFTVKARGGSALTEAIVLGRCVQGSRSNIDRWVEIPAQMVMVLQALECSNKGSSLTIGTDVDGAGLDATILFDNNVNKVVHQAQAAGRLDVSLGEPLRIRKGGKVNAAGGNPHVFGRFVDDGGDVLTDEAYLGRCKDMG